MRNLLKICRLLITESQGLNLVNKCRLSYQQDAHEAVNFLTQKNDEVCNKKSKLKEENTHLLEIIEEMKKSSSVTESIPNTCTEKMGTLVHGRA